MRAYQHTAEIVLKFHKPKGPQPAKEEDQTPMGFKSAFYEYVEKHEKEIGS